MVQRKTQTPAYWQGQFTINSKDLEFIYNQILENNRVFTLDEIALALVKRQYQAEELAARSEFQQGKLYQPKESYAVGEQVVFPHLDFAVGTVKTTRQGHHPVHGTFTVIAVSFPNGSDTREFATNFDHPHPLNLDTNQSLASLQGLMPPEEIYQTYLEFIRPKVEAALKNSNDFVKFHGQYFLRDLLPDFHEGLFNIADAAIDINNGPLSVDALIEQMGLAEGKDITDTLRFSVSYRLANDERFDDVGPTGQVLWYLERIEPPEAHHAPRRLQLNNGNQSYDIDLFDEDLLALLTEIDDEATPVEHLSAVDPNPQSVTIVLNYPHRRVGTLPLTPKTESLFPSSHYNPVLFEFVDGRTGDTFPGWTALNDKYVFGLDEWYNKNKLPVGAYINIKRTDNPMRIIVDYQAMRSQRDWVRTANVSGNKLVFQMSKEAINCKYDELMIIGESNQAQIDAFWLNASEKKLSIYDILCQIFPELSKLNPQSTVHAKTLYSAVNVVRRAAPGTIFQELVSHRCFIPMKNGYWIYDPNLRD
ncbi:MAG: hypothetical protein Fur0044_09350 [Anaerolineae bacterium]